MRGKKAKRLRRMADATLNDAERHGYEIPKDGLVRLPGNYTAINRPGSRRAVRRIWKKTFGRIK